MIELGQLAGIDAITLVPVLEQCVLAEVAHHQFVNLRVQQIVQPDGPTFLLRRSPTEFRQACKELKNRCRFGLQDGFHD
jgi:hypothetical protein